MNRKRRALAFGALASMLEPIAARAQVLEGIRFSSLQAGVTLPPWLNPVTFRGRPATTFTLVNDEGVTVLRAFAQASASGLGRQVRIDPAVHRRVAWRWKVTNLVTRSDPRTREGDDFAARLYLRFGRRLGADLALCYVWDSRAPIGTAVPNAWSDRVRMVVVDSGAALLGRWVERERDFGTDFREAFGEAAPAVSAVIVSTDTDNTGETAEAFFGDILFR